MVENNKDKDQDCDNDVDKYFGNGSGRYDGKKEIGRSVSADDVCLGKENVRRDGNKEGGKIIKKEEGIYNKIDSRTNIKKTMKNEEGLFNKGDTRTNMNKLTKNDEGNFNKGDTRRDFDVRANINKTMKNDEGSFNKDDTRRDPNKTKNGEDDVRASTSKITKDEERKDKVMKNEEGSTTKVDISKPLKTEDITFKKGISKSLLNEDAVGNVNDNRRYVDEHGHRVHDDSFYEGRENIRSRYVPKPHHPTQSEEYIKNRVMYENNISKDLGNNNVKEDYRGNRDYFYKDGDQVRYDSKERELQGKYDRIGIKKEKGYRVSKESVDDDRSNSKERELQGKYDRTEIKNEKGYRGSKESVDDDRSNNKNTQVYRKEEGKTMSKNEKGYWDPKHKSVTKGERNYWDDEEEKSNRGYKGISKGYNKSDARKDHGSSDLSQDYEEEETVSDENEEGVDTEEEESVEPVDKDDLSNSNVNRRYLDNDVGDYRSFHSNTTDSRFYDGNLANPRNPRAAPKYIQKDFMRNKVDDMHRNNRDSIYSENALKEKKEYVPYLNNTYKELKNENLNHKNNHLKERYKGEEQEKDSNCNINVMSKESSINKNKESLSRKNASLSRDITSKHSDENKIFRQTSPNDKDHDSNNDKQYNHHLKNNKGHILIDPKNTRGNSYHPFSHSAESYSRVIKNIKKDSRPPYESSYSGKGNISGELLPRPSQIGIDEIHRKNQSDMICRQGMVDRDEITNPNITSLKGSDVLPAGIQNKGGELMRRPGIHDKDEITHLNLNYKNSDIRRPGVNDKDEITNLNLNHKNSDIRRPGINDKDEAISLNSHHKNNETMRRPGINDKDEITNLNLNHKNNDIRRPGINDKDETISLNSHHKNNETMRRPGMTDKDEISSINLHHKNIDAMRRPGMTDKDEISSINLHHKNFDAMRRPGLIHSENHLRPNIVTRDTSMPMHPRSIRSKSDDPDLSDAMVYLNRVKEEFFNDIVIYDTFLELMRDYKQAKIDAGGVLKAVSTLFKGKKYLVDGFNNFLPKQFRIDDKIMTRERETSVRDREMMNMDRDRQLIDRGFVRTPGYHADRSMMHERIPLNDRPDRNMLNERGPMYDRRMERGLPLQENRGMERIDNIRPDNRMNIGDRNVVNGRILDRGIIHERTLEHGSIHERGLERGMSIHDRKQERERLQPYNEARNVTERQPMTNNNSIYRYPRPDDANKQRKALNFVQKVKRRLTEKPEAYRSFIEILQQYQKSPGDPNRIMVQLRNILLGHDDLLDEFVEFVPKQGEIDDSDIIIYNKEGTLNKDSIDINQNANKEMYMNRNNRVDINTLIGNNNLPPNPTLKSKSIYNQNVPNAPLNEGIENEYNHSKAINENANTMFTDIVNLLKQKSLLDNFLKLLNMYNQNLVSAKDLVSLLGPILKNRQLLEAFKEYIKYKEIDNVPYILKNVNEYKKIGSYRILPEKYRLMGSVLEEKKEYLKENEMKSFDFNRNKNSILKKQETIGDSSNIEILNQQSYIAKEVLNFFCVSAPSLSSEESTFCSSKKSIYEESLFRVEDERYEFDLVKYRCEEFCMNITALLYRINVERKRNVGIDDDEIEYITKKNKEILFARNNMSNERYKPILDSEEHDNDENRLKEHENIKGLKIKSRGNDYENRLKDNNNIIDDDGNSKGIENKINIEDKNSIVDDETSKDLKIKNEDGNNKGIENKIKIEDKNKIVDNEDSKRIENKNMIIDDKHILKDNIIDDQNSKRIKVNNDEKSMLDDKNKTNACNYIGVSESDEFIMANGEVSNIVFTIEDIDMSAGIVQEILNEAYGEKGFEVLEAILTRPREAIPIVINRMNLILKDNNEKKRNKKRFWGEIVERNFYKALDIESNIFKSNEKKILSIKKNEKKTNLMHNNILNDIEEFFYVYLKENDIMFGNEINKKVDISKENGKKIKNINNINDYSLEIFGFCIELLSSENFRIFNITCFAALIRYILILYERMEEIKIISDEIYEDTIKNENIVMKNQLHGPFTSSSDVLINSQGIFQSNMDFKKDNISHNIESKSNNQSENKDMNNNESENKDMNNNESENKDMNNNESENKDKGSNESENKDNNESENKSSVNNSKGCINNKYVINLTNKKDKIASNTESENKEKGGINGNMNKNSINNKDKTIINKQSAINNNKKCAFIDENFGVGLNKGQSISQTAAEKLKLLPVSEKYKKEHRKNIYNEVCELIKMNLSARIDNFEFDEKIRILTDCKGYKILTIEKIMGKIEKQINLIASNEVAKTFMSLKDNKMNKEFAESVVNNDTLFKIWKSKGKVEIQEQSEIDISDTLGINENKNEDNNNQNNPSNIISNDKNIDPEKKNTICASDNDQQTENIFSNTNENTEFKQYKEDFVKMKINENLIKNKVYLEREKRKQPEIGFERFGLEILVKKRSLEMKYIENTEDFFIRKGKKRKIVMDAESIKE